MHAELRRLLEAEDYPAIANLSLLQRRTLSYLTAISYDPDPRVAWRSVHAMGQASACLADQHSEFVRGHLRRLLWLLSDESGGIGWRAPELLGEIVLQRPDTFAEFAPPIFSLLDMEAEQDTARFLPGTLWACGRLAPAFPQHAQAALPRLLSALQDPRPLARGMALWCLGQAAYRGPLPNPEQLSADHGAVLLKDGARLVATTVSRLAIGLSQGSPGG